MAKTQRQKLKTQIVLLTFAWVFATLNTNDAWANSKERPNIVVIVADDLGYGDLGVTGNRKIKTPNIDALARDGALFNHFYSPAQVCSPSRASMMTGRMPHRLGIYSFIGGSSGDLVHLPKTEVTIPQILRKAGYQTAIIGKWHNSLNLVQAKNDKIPSMDHYGFDYWFSSDDNGINLDKPNWIRNGKTVGKVKGYTANTVGREAVRWLKEVRDPKKPFIQFVHFYEPHWTVEAPKSLTAKYLKSATENANEAVYLGAVNNVDLEVGNILKTLSELGIEDDTAIFFSSDHGPARLENSKRFKRNYGSAKPYRGNKYGLWEGSIHVPGIVRWPAKVKQGLVINEPAGSIDWLPTICEMANVKIPKDLVLDGQSHLSLLLGQSMKRKKPLQWHHYNTNVKNSPNPNAVMRLENYVICGFYEQKSETRLKRASWRPSHYKRIKNGKLVRFALYNVVKDPNQQSDLAKKEKTRFDKMRKQLIALHTAMQEQAVGWKGATPIRKRKTD